MLGVSVGVDCRLRTQLVQACLAGWPSAMPPPACLRLSFESVRGTVSSRGMVEVTKCLLVVHVVRDEGTRRLILDVGVPTSVVRWASSSAIRASNSSLPTIAEPYSWSLGGRTRIRLDSAVTIAPASSCEPYAASTERHTLTCCDVESATRRTMPQCACRRTIAISPKSLSSV